MNTLVSSEELAERLQNPIALRIFDCRHDLADPQLGEQQYADEHIPGALFAHLDRDLSGPKTGKNGRHPLPEPKVFVTWLGKQGLQPTDQVVCYDGGPGAMASRLWWMLRWVGHPSVAVLDGGFAKWQKEGRPVSKKISQPTSWTYPGDNLRKLQNATKPLPPAGIATLGHDRFAGTDRASLDSQAWSGRSGAEGET